MKKILGIGLLLIALLATGVSAQRATWEVYCQGVANTAYDASYSTCMNWGLFTETQCEDYGWWMSYGPTGAFYLCMDGLLQ